MERARSSYDAGLGCEGPWGRQPVLPPGTGSLGVLAGVGFAPLLPPGALSVPCGSPLRGRGAAVLTGSWAGDPGVSRAPSPLPVSQAGRGGKPA